MNGNKFCAEVVEHCRPAGSINLNTPPDKDLEAFRVVIKKTGHPTEVELIHELPTRDYKQELRDAVAAYGVSGAE